MRRQDLQRLSQVAETVYEAELARMRNNRAAAAKVEAGVAEIRAARRERADATRALEAPDPSQLASADLHWDRWTDERLHRLQGERARLEAEAEAMRDDARRAFGRRRALDKLSHKLAEEARRRRQRRDAE